MEPFLSNDLLVNDQFKTQKNTLLSSVLLLFKVVLGYFSIQARNMDF